MKELNPHVNTTLSLTHETEKLASMYRCLEKPTKEEEKQ
jgi:hypothetical protein